MTYKDNRKSKVFLSKEGYDKYASFYDEKLDFLDGFEGEEIWKMIGKAEGKRVLDAGCGTGRLIKILFEKGAFVTGLDIAPEMLKIAGKKFKKAEFVEGNVEKMPFEDDSFDMVTAGFVIVHLKDLRKFFDEVYRILKPGGVFILTNVNQRKAPKLRLANREDLVITSFYHIPKQVISALEESFFNIEEEKFVHGNAVWINQIIKATKGGLFDKNGGFK
ncbi:MAG: class I SAM-dependent methyltransferase [Candidatus Gracilibacteria bacterium]|nr:class I SAM-dependent methyltransferase [Candidatus Gracilibacteria bacterium]